jgi:transcription antitermination factor NusG
MSLPQADPIAVDSDDLNFHSRQWYAVYTRARHEKKVACHLEGRDFECFLPLHESVHAWNDRSSVVAVPLFSGYVFVRAELSERMRVLTVPGVVQLVGSTRGPLPIPEQEIESIRACIQSRQPLNAHEYLTTGTAVMVKCGPMTGLQGILVRWAHGTRLVLSINLIRASVSVEVDAADVIRVDTPQPHISKAAA